MDMGITGLIVSFVSGILFEIILGKIDVWHDKKSEPKEDNPDEEYNHIW